MINKTNITWTSVRGCPQNTGSSAKPGPKKNPDLKWRHDVGTRIFGTPLIVDDTVFVATSSPVQQTAGTVVALDRDSGTRTWISNDKSMGVRGTPAISDDRLYFGDLMGTLYVLDITDGRVIDSLSVGDSPSDGTYILIEEGTVFAQPYRLLAMDSESLSREWESDDDALFQSPFAIADDELIAGGYWHDGDPLYIGQGEDDMAEFVHPAAPFVRAVNLHTGTTNWETVIDGLPRGTGVVDGTIFVAAAGSDPLGKRVTKIIANPEKQLDPDETPSSYESYGIVSALDRETGTEVWQTRLPSMVRTMPAVNEQYVSVGTTAGELVTLDAGTGEQVWTVRINSDNAVLSSPTIAGDVVYIGSDDDAIKAFDLADGNQLWQYGTHDAVDANIAVVEGTLYTADNGGTVYSLEEPT